MPRRRYPSDDRPYFRVLDAILDDEKLNALALEDQAIFFRLLATLNRQRSRDGWGFLNRFAACALAKRERWAYAVPAFDRLAAGGLLRVEYRDGGVAYLSPKWPIIQGFTPAELRPNSVQTPPLRVEEIRVEKTKSEKPARVARGQVKSDPPEALKTEEQEALEGWCKDRWPALVQRLPDLVSACFTFHRSKGNRHADWYATAQTWVRNEAEGRFGKTAVNGTALVSPKPNGPSDDELWALKRRGLLLQPTREYWREWVAAGKPEESLWWIPASHRAEMAGRY